jgi:hypothetical protein
MCFSKQVRVLFFSLDAHFSTIVNTFTTKNSTMRIVLQFYSWSALLFQTEPALDLRSLAFVGRMPFLLGRRQGVAKRRGDIAGARCQGGASNAADSSPQQRQPQVSSLTHTRTLTPTHSLTHSLSHLSSLIMEREGGASYSSTQIREGDELQLAIVLCYSCPLHNHRAEHRS